MKIIIYDFGANNGDDISYYLKKADLVVAVEANPELVHHIQNRFSEAISSGCLIVVNAVLTKNEQDNRVAFYIHKTNNVLSQFPRPNGFDIGSFREIYLPSRRASDIVSEFGFPHYIKIDVEQYDQEILEDLFLANIKPEFISAESHSIEVFSSLVSLGGYRFFKLVDGASVPIRFHNHKISTLRGDDVHSFAVHSAGPFGDDLPGNWVSPTQLFEILATVKLGWKDIHAAREPGRNVPKAPLTASLSPTRNSPCPCGSGKKYKHCHGSFKITQH